MIAQSNLCINMSKEGPDQYFEDVPVKFIYACTIYLFLKNNNALKCVQNPYFKFKKVPSYFGSTKMSYFPSNNEFVCFYMMKKKIPVLVDTKRRYSVIPMIHDELTSNLLINKFYKIDQNKIKYAANI